MTVNGAGAARAEEWYNLLDEPWIVGVLDGGRHAEMSLLDVFRRAHEVRCLGGEVPTQAFAVLRLLLAILHRAVQGPATVDDWIRVRDDWELTVRRVEEYLKRYRDRFYLFHPTDPFMQVAGLGSSSNESPLERLIADVPTGEPFMTTRLGRGLQRLSPSEAARWLVHAHTFDTSGIKTGVSGHPRAKNGKVFPEGVSWGGRLGGVYAEGDDLRETLLLNLVALDEPELGLRHGPEDAPVWERPRIGVGPDPSGTEPRGVVDAYTWQSRRIRLVTDAESVVAVVLTYGDGISASNRMDVEPMTAWRYSEPQSKAQGADVYLPARHEPGRDLWRGLAALLPHAVDTLRRRAERRRGIPPAIVLWLGIVQRDGLLSRPLTRLRAVGVEYGPKDSSYAEILDDAIALPSDALADEDAAALVIHAADLGESVVEALISLHRNVLVAEGSAETEARNSAKIATGERAYREVGSAYRAWVERSATMTRDAALDDWRDVLRDRATAIADAILAGASPAAWRVRPTDDSSRRPDAGLADRWFRSTLTKLLAVAPQLIAEEGGETA